jgi:hypothetical protein
MTVKVLQEAGYEMALLGLSFNKKQPLDRMPKVAEKLAPMNGGHSKFLESIYLWIDIKAPRDFWQEADTYRVGSSKQSESTMYNLMKADLTQADFSIDIPEFYLEMLNMERKHGSLFRLKKLLPEGYLQRRLWCINYKTLSNIISQRSSHRLPEWKIFITNVISQVKYPELLPTFKPSETLEVSEERTAR